MNIVGIESYQLIVQKLFTKPDWYRYYLFIYLNWYD